MAKTASTPGRRFMKLAGMTASIAGKTLSNSIKNLTADDEQKNTARSKIISGYWCADCGYLGGNERRSHESWPDRLAI